jgi:DNA-binding transcriptional regulator YdaS (Cro superfamily)
MESENPLVRAIKAAGNQEKLAAKIGASQQLVSYWLKKGKRGVPAEYVLPIEAATGISRHDLRPDIYGAAPGVAA